MARRIRQRYTFLGFAPLRIIQSDAANNAQRANLIEQSGERLPIWLTLTMEGSIRPPERMQPKHRGAVAHAFAVEDTFGDQRWARASLSA